MFVDKLFDEAKNLLQARKNINCVLREPMEKYIVLHQKIWADLLESHPYAFVSHIRSLILMDFSQSFIFSSTPPFKKFFFPKFLFFLSSIHWNEENLYFRDKSMNFLGKSIKIAFHVQFYFFSKFVKYSEKICNPDFSLKKSDKAVNKKILISQGKFFSKNQTPSQFLLTVYFVGKIWC